MGRTYPKFEKAHDIQHPESYVAVKGKSTHEALMSVQLAMEQSRLSNFPMIIAPKDATGCFDLIRPELIQLIQNSKGVPPATTSAKTTIQQNMKTFVQTGYGRSAQPVQRTPENNLGWHLGRMWECQHHERLKFQAWRFWHIGNVPMKVQYTTHLFHVRPRSIDYLHFHGQYTCSWGC